MNVQLDDQTEALVQQKVRNGQYRNPNEVVQEAIRQMDERDRRLEELRAALAIGEEQIAQGEVVEWTPQLAAAILEEAKQAARTGKRPKSDVAP
jgi:antitoxin ParD1/3/4